ncbi:MAG: carbonic anhydrase [Myxococcales bacterium]|jgi:carbonic anhydrase|nr:carbonic anhydrase [Myxococcales bacterium]
MSDFLRQALANNERWAERKRAEDPEYFERLARGQNPEILYIGCSDSRVTVEEMLGAAPGQVFVHRNIANQVVLTDANVGAVLQYAVEQLHVEHIVVCGHYECGGVASALAPTDMGQLNNWLQTLRDVYRLHRTELDAELDDRLRSRLLVELNVREQCLNVIKSHHVQRAWYKTGFPKVHPWVFDIEQGRVRDLGLDMSEEFADLRAIYDLKPVGPRAR